MKKLIILIGLVFLLSACHQQQVVATKPGVYHDFTLLPNGWRLTPVGRHIRIGEFPLNLLITPDEQWAITSNSGTGEHGLSLVSLKNLKEVQRLVLPKTWRGLASNKTGSQFYISGGNDDCVYILGWQADTLQIQDTLFLAKSSNKTNISVTGLAYWTPDRLLVVSKGVPKLFLLDLKSKKVLKALSMPAACYEVLVNEKTNQAYVSVWGKKELMVVDLLAMQISDSIQVGSHPCEMVLSQDGQRLFVANANQNTVSVVDLVSKRVVETLNSAISPQLPPGSTPNSLALSSDGRRLYVANADNNYVAVFDISEMGQSKSLGFIPVGWYPTAVRILKSTGQIVVANGKGLASAANPQGPKPGHPELPFDVHQYIGQMFQGTLSIIPEPNLQKLSNWTRRVYENVPFSRKTVKKAPSSKVVPVEHNGQKSSVLKYVFYIIRENRTYDQVFGDLKQGNGDSALCLFPRRVTPNAHKLAETFVLFDNFYADAEVSADGHNWSTAAYATDYVEKTWPTLYGRRGGKYDFEGSEISRPFSGYIWDNCLKHGVSVRDYGEFVKHDPQNKNRFVANVPGLKGHVCPTFPGWNLAIPDTFRFERWRADFDSLVSKGQVAAFNILRFPNDHTAGTNPKFPTVEAMIAENDYALGLFVEHLSHSSIWKNSIVFVVEDDAQNGSDHVDAHRSPLLVISPYLKRHWVDHTMYSTSSVLKTMELILGLPPMTQFDLAATPILDPFTEQADFTPYVAVKPAINLHQMNSPQAYRAERCLEFNLSKEDAIPDIEFNEIIWKAVKGAQSQMPPPVRSAFVQIRSEDD